MKIISLEANNQKIVLKKAVEVLKNAGLIIYPTETCYGVGVDATNLKAVEKLLKYKERPVGKAISIAVTDKEMARKYIAVNQTAENLYNNFLPGPITVISQVKGFKGGEGVWGRSVICKGIIAEDGSLGIRIPDYRFTLQLIKQFGKPITATSANLSGRKTPYSINDILDNVSEKNKKLIGLIIDAGELPHNPPSTVVDTRLNNEKILRNGTWNQKQGTKKKTNVKSLTSHSEKETQEIGKKLMQKYLSYLENKCIVFALSGDLGAGKTQLAKGVARALGVKENVTSPTFVLAREYKFNLDSHQGIMHHIDTWRMQEGSELTNLGLNEMVKRGNVIVIEWVEKIENLLSSIKDANNVCVITISIAQKNQATRTIEVYNGLC